jgi:hypothetical protein
MQLGGVRVLPRAYRQPLLRRIWSVFIALDLHADSIRSMILADGLRQRLQYLEVDFVHA